MNQALVTMLAAVPGATAIAWTFVGESIVIGPLKTGEFAVGRVPSVV